MRRPFGGLARCGGPVCCCARPRVCVTHAGRGGEPAGLLQRVSSPRARACRGRRVVEGQVHPLPISCVGLRAGRESAGGSWFRPATGVRQGRLLARTGPGRGVGGVAVRERERRGASFRGARGKPGGDDREPPLRRACDGRQAQLRGGGELEDPGRELPRVLPLLLPTSRALQGEPAQEWRGPRGSGGLDRRLHGARGSRRDHVANRRELRLDAAAPDGAPGAGSVLLPALPEPAHKPPSRLRNDPPPQAPRSLQDRRGVRVAVLERSGRVRGVRSFVRERVLGPDQRAGLGSLRRRTEGRFLARLPAGPALTGRVDVGQVRGDGCQRIPGGWDLPGVGRSAQVGARSGARTLSTRASTATHPDGPTITGLTSRAPMRSPRSRASRESCERALASAFTSAGSEPLTPSSSGRASSLSISFEALTSSRGGRARRLSPSVSISTPPAATVTSGPNWGSLTTPSAISTPGSTISCTVTAEPRRDDISL